MSDLYRHAYGAARFSTPRSRLARAACDFEGAFTIDELTDAAGSPAVATATVYRAVAAMEATGFLERVGERSGAALYAHCDAHAHHHHIVCDRCGKTAAAECPLSARDTAPRADGFVITRHEVTLYGLCRECAQAPRRSC